MADDATRLPQGIIIDSAGLAAARPVGTIVLNTADNMLYRSTNATVATYTAITGQAGIGTAIPDPGTGAAIPVTQSGQIGLTTGTGAETNTLAIPTFAGQQLGIVLGTAGGGTRTITSAQAVNQANNTKLAFTQAADACILTAFSIGGALRWRVTYNDGVTLS